jgi:hypothetical protein
MTRSREAPLPAADASDASDAAIIRRCQDEPEQFAILFRRHEPHIRRYVARRLGADAADDVVAETLRAGLAIPAPWWRAWRPSRTTRGGNRPAGAFELVGRLFGAYLMPPALTAELYRALGDIPGVTVRRDVPDLAGQRGVALRLPVPSGAGYEEIVIDPRSYQFMGWDSRSADAVYGDAVLVQALVSGPGVRP